MATFKKATKKTTRKANSSNADARAKAERLSKSLSESAQQIWQAGVGAFGRAQEEGSKLFEGLVKEGLNLEQSARKFAGGRAEVVRDVVETGVGQARDRATDTWDRLEKVFEDRVQRALTRLGVPGRDDLTDLSERVEALTGQLRRQNGATARRAPAKKVVAKKPAGRVAKKTAKPASAVRQAAAKRAATAKPAARTVAKKASTAGKPAAASASRGARTAKPVQAARTRRPKIVTPSPISPTDQDA